MLNRSGERKHSCFVPVFRGKKPLAFHHWVWCYMWYLLCWDVFLLKVKVAQSCLTLCNLMHYTVHGILQARILESVPFLFSRGSSQPRDRTQISCIGGRFFTSWATREVQGYGVGSLSLFQGIFLTQESNRGLLHYRQILYQLSYEGSPLFLYLYSLYF